MLALLPAASATAANRSGTVTDTTPFEWDGPAATGSNTACPRTPPAVVGTPQPASQQGPRRASRLVILPGARACHAPAAPAALARFGDGSQGRAYMSLPLPLLRRRR